MLKHLLLAAYLLVSSSCFAQYMTISGSVQDTAFKKPLSNSVAMAVRLKDSVMVAFTRSNEKGDFSFPSLKIDTLELIVSNPLFGDQSFYIVGSQQNKVFDLGIITLPPKNKDLQEVIIYAFKDPVYYKGDTLIYSADSFKVKPNATVEDLLKKLPGITVDQNGKITTQGKKVDQVLVDGDEFFGTDPTVATRNLGANTVESVQVYEKKDENNSGENLQIMNLKLKDDAKKGYFGKATAASDFQKFYEGELFTNKFKGSQKISVFGLAANTPKTNVGYGDIYKYGLDNENQNQFNEETFTWTAPYEPTGIPRNLRAGIYYNDKLGKKTKLNANYTFGSKRMNAGTSARSQYFLSDTTYSTTAESKDIQNTESHAINMKLTQTIDSLTELEIEPKLKLNNNQGSNRSLTSFYTMKDSLARQTDVYNASTAAGYNLNTYVHLTRKFMKKDRKLRVHYTLLLNESESKGELKSLNFGTDTLKDINQKKNNDVNNQTHTALIGFTEPITKKIKLGVEYNMNFNRSKQSKTTKDFMNGDYTFINPLLTNSFENRRSMQTLGGTFMYETKKRNLYVGARARNISFTNTNLINDEKFVYSVNTLLPFLYFYWNIGDGARFNFRYNSSSNQPSIDQLQPIPDNSNPLQVKVGNPDLKPSYNNSIAMFYNMFKPSNGRYLGFDFNFSAINNDFTNSIVYDETGRALIQTVNVDGNYISNFAMWGGIPFNNKMFTIDPNIWASYQKNTNFINNQKNITKTAGLNTGLGLSLNLDTLNFRLNYNYSYNVPSSSLNLASNKPYFRHEYAAYLFLKLPFKFEIETDAKYIVNSNRAPGYNINYVLWNARIGKTFLKTENLILSVIGNDLLNKNISNERTVTDNIITDTKTNIITRYFLLQLVYKFNNSKTKYNDDF
jgi:hypothetical protein